MRFRCCACQFFYIFGCKDTTKIAHTQVNNENIVQKEEILYFWRSNRTIVSYQIFGMSRQRTRCWYSVYPGNPAASIFSSL